PICPECGHQLADGGIVCPGQKVRRPLWMAILIWTFNYPWVFVVLSLLLQIFPPDPLTMLIGNFIVWFSVVLFMVLQRIMSNRSLATMHWETYEQSQWAPREVR